MSYITINDLSVIQSNKITGNEKLIITDSNNNSKSIEFESVIEYAIENFDNTVDEKLELKVDKVIGKQLSTEDFTTAEKNKLIGIAIGANNYTMPAVTLATYCYNSMFYGCTSLTTAPSLPATILANNCYQSMFSGCSKLKLSTTLTGIYDTAYRIPTSGTGTTASNALESMFLSTGGTFTGTPTINTTYYTENTPV